MKRFFHATAAVGLALALTAPMALAQPAPYPDTTHKHPAPPPPATTTQHTTTVQHGNGTVVQHTTTTTTTQQPNWLDTLHTPSGQPPGDFHPPGYGAPPEPHAVDSHQWHHGDRYTGSREVVTNWSAYHVQRPPSGYEYVRDGNQLVLIAIASGVIADVLANAAYQ